MAIGGPPCTIPPPIGGRILVPICSVDDVTWFLTASTIRGWNDQSVPSRRLQHRPRAESPVRATPLAQTGDNLQEDGVAFGRIKNGASGFVWFSASTMPSVPQQRLAWAMMQQFG